MLAIILYVAGSATLVGMSMARSSTGEQGWCLLTVPMSAISVGLPSAVAFGLLLPRLPDPLIGLQGDWRAVIIGVALGIVARLVLAVVARSTVRRRDWRRLLGKVWGFGFAGAVLGALWGLVHWAAG